MATLTRRRGAQVAALATMTCIGLAAAGCSSSSSPKSSTSPKSSASSMHSGPVDVLSAGSLDTLMTKTIGPAFHAATGYTLVDTSGGSGTLAADIKNKVNVADVFVSASPAVDTTLEGSANGNWVSWYDQFASSPLVLGYNPASKFAQDLKTKPWYEVVSEPGFRLGRTDPATDPKGVLAVDALDAAATKYDIPELRTLATATNNVFPETSLVGELQAGQLDAGFFYGVEASAAHLHVVPLAGTSLAGDYTITILNRAPHQAAAAAFVNFLLGPGGQKILAANGVLVGPPNVTGSQYVPASVKATVK